MSIWLIRAGSHGEFEQKFIQEKRVYVTWDELNVDLSQLDSRDALFGAMVERYGAESPNRLRNWVRQIWPFAHEIQKGDWVVLPSKRQPVIYIGEITSGYRFEPNGPDPFFHWRSVKWIGEAIPRARFAQDLLYSFGAFLTICRIQRNDAAARLKVMHASNWMSESEDTSVPKVTAQAGDQSPTRANLAELAADQIADLVHAKFQKHDLTRLVDAILRAQGYITYVSPAGPDGGADILAGAGLLGFTSPNLVVEVKSGNKPVDRPTVDKLLGAVGKFGAQQGLFVSWAGFKTNVFRELAPSFFKLRLWTQNELIEALLSNYDRLDEEIKAEIPLKRIWTVATQDD